MQFQQLLKSQESKDKERLQAYMERWRQNAEFEAVGDLEPIDQPIPLIHYYAIHLRSNQPNLPKTAENTLIFFMVSLISNRTKRCFGLNSHNMHFYFGKFCEKKEFAREVEAHKILDAIECPNIIKLATSVPTNELGEGIIITNRYAPYSMRILKPFTKEVMQQLLKAISCCHANGIIHRDIKPANIVFEWNEEDQEHPHIYLIDFNVACKVEYHLNRNYDESSRTECYQAPERLQLKPSKEPTKMDLWSAGVTFAEMLLGYDSDEQTLFEYGDKEEFDEFEAKRNELFKDIDPVARDLLDKLLAVDTTQRLSADEALMHPYFTQSTEEKILPNVTNDYSSEEETSSTGTTHSKDECSHVVATFSSSDEETSSPDVTKNLEPEETPVRKRKRSNDEEKGNRKKKRRDS